MKNDLQRQNRGNENCLKSRLELSTEYVNTVSQNNIEVADLTYK